MISNKDKRASLGISCARKLSLGGGNHIRLVALAALYIAEKYDGVIVDLLTRKAWSPESWRRAISASQIKANQTRIVRQRGGKSGGRIRSLGWLKFGLPDVVLRDIPTADMKRVHDVMLRHEESVLVKGIKPGMSLPGLEDFRVLRVCPEAVRLDGDCLTRPR